MSRSSKLPHPKSFPRELIRAAIDELVAEGLPLVSISQTQLRMRLGGGSWQTLRDELERARGRPLGATTRSLAEQEAPADLAARVDSIERLLAQAGQEVSDLVGATSTAREAARQAHDQEIRALQAEIDRLVAERPELRRSPAAADPAAAGDRKSGRKRSRAARAD